MDTPNSKGFSKEVSKDFSVGDGVSTRKKWRYSSPFFQVILLAVIFVCCPGMLNALNGLGGAGKSSATITDHANTALGVTFAISSLLAGGVYNKFGHGPLLLFGGLCYALYVGSYLSYAEAFVVTSGALLGLGAGCFWAAQGAIMLSYPDEGDKGKYIGLFWSIFNLGGAFGSIIPLGLEWNSNGKTEIATSTYTVFMSVMVTGAFLSILELPSSKVIRSNGAAVSQHIYTSWDRESIEVLKLFTDRKMLLMMPMSIASTWGYAYYFNCFNGGGLFTTRTRALNSTIFYLAAIVASPFFGSFLDSTFISKHRRLRAFGGLSVLCVLSVIVYGGGYFYQRTFSRESLQLYGQEQRLDFSLPHSYIIPAFVYCGYGLLDAMYQTFAYWLLGALTNSTAQAARYSGFFKCLQNVGIAVAGQIDANHVAFSTELKITWVMISAGLLSTFFVAKDVKERTLENLHIDRQLKPTSSSRVMTGELSQELEGTTQLKPNPKPTASKSKSNSNSTPQTDIETGI